jgi:hypothetical protein
MRSIAKQIEYGDKEIKNGELVNQINIGVISTEGIELKKQKYLPCRNLSALFAMIKKRCKISKQKGVTKTHPVKNKSSQSESSDSEGTQNTETKKNVGQVGWAIVKKHAQINDGGGEIKDKEDHSLHNNTPSNFKWTRPPMSERWCKALAETIIMILVELFVVMMTLVSFPFCGLFLVLYLSSYKSIIKNSLCQKLFYNTKSSDDKERVTGLGNLDKPKEIYSLRSFLSSTNRYAGHPLSLWWNALIGNECKYLALLSRYFYC